MTTEVRRSRAAVSFGAALGGAVRKINYATHKSSSWLSQQDRKVANYAMQLCRTAEDFGDDTARLLRETGRSAREEWVRIVPLRWC